MKKLKDNLYAPNETVQNYNEGNFENLEAGVYHCAICQVKDEPDKEYLYIEFDRSTRRYTMWDNIGSMYATDTTGTFTITEERDGSYTLTGTYDHGVGDWNYAYRVTLHSEGEGMEWISRDEAQWMEFRRIDSMPELY